MEELFYADLEHEVHWDWDREYGDEDGDGDGGVFSACLSVPVPEAPSRAPYVSSPVPPQPGPLVRLIPTVISIMSGEGHPRPGPSPPCHARASPVRPSVTHRVLFAVAAGRTEPEGAGRADSRVGLLIRTGPC